MLFNTKQQVTEQHDNKKEEVQPTESQRRILELIANGCNQEQVSQALGIKYDTAQKQLSLLRRRLHVSTLEQTIAIAARRGWIRVDDYPRLRS